MHPKNKNVDFTTSNCGRTAITSYARGCRCPACRQFGKDYRATPKRKQYALSRRQDPALEKTRHEKRLKKRSLLKQLVDGIKLERGCYDCGYNINPLALEFDHVRGDKVNNVSVLRANRSQKKLIEELGKCEVRCANCHAIKTEERRKNSP